MHGTTIATKATDSATIAASASAPITTIEGEVISRNEEHANKLSFHIKQSPNSSRVTTPIHNLSSVIKYEATDEPSVNLTLAKDMQPQHGQQQHERGLGDGEKTEDEEAGTEGDGDYDDDDDEQPCDLRLQRSLKIVSMAIQQAAAVAAASGGAAGGSTVPGMVEHDVATAAAMAAMIGGSGGAVGSGVATTVVASNTVANFPSTHAHASLLNFTPTSVAPISVSLLTSALASNLDITPADGNVSIIITTTTATSSTMAIATTTTSSSAAGSTVTSIPTSTSVVATSTGGINAGSGSGGGGVGGGGGGTGGTWGGAYTCDRCGNSYARPHSLNRHVRFECGVEPKFECPICHKKSKHKHNLVLHMRTHQHR